MQYRRKCDCIIQHKCVHTANAQDLHQEYDRQVAFYAVIDFLSQQLEYLHGQS